MSLEADHPALQADAVVIGAGPVGLWQVFQLGLQGIAAHLVDALPHAGGQCAELYGDKPIYDIPGIGVCSGQELTERLLAQIAPFAPVCHFGQQVETLAAQPGGRLLLGTSTGTRIAARGVFIAAGVGAFVPRTVKAEGLTPFTGTQVLYHPADMQAARGRQVVVHGGDAAAVQAAIDCAPLAASVTLLHRRDAFQAPADALTRLQALRDAGRVRVLAGQITGAQVQDGRLCALTLLDSDGQASALPLDLLLAYLGISPRLGPVADWGLAMQRKQLQVDTATFTTSVPGIHAVGDVVTYPGKRRLIVCGFHEATLAAFACAERLAGAPVPLEYTTSSARLQQRLGVAPPPGA